MSPSESLSSSGTESETERMTDFEKFGLQPYSLEPTRSKVLVGYGKNSVSDLTNSSNVSSGKWSDPGHFLKSQGNFFLSFPCTLFLHIFDI